MRPAWNARRSQLFATPWADVTRPDGTGCLTMRIRLRNIFLMGAVVLGLAACSSASGLPKLPETSNVDTAYRLGPGDELRLIVVGAKDLTGDYPVSDSGTVSVPLIGDVKAQGLTRVQLEREIADDLAKGYIRNPRVNVSVIKYRPFYVYGEVSKPGDYPYASGMRVLNAIATAGGYTYRANHNYVIITRSGRKWTADGATPIQPDDVIQVPERLF